MAMSDFDKQMEKILNNEFARIVNCVEPAAEVAANYLLEKAKMKAPKRTGKYKKNIAVKAISNSTHNGRIWYVKNPHYRKTHLIIKGHRLRNGKMSKANDFLSEDVKKSKQLFIDELKKNVEGM